MLKAFDWLRLCRSGAELIATLRLLQRDPDLFAQEEIGPPHSALLGPCRRCHIYPRFVAPARARHGEAEVEQISRRPRRVCQTCRGVLTGAYQLRELSRQTLFIWANVNRLPRQFTGSSGFGDSRILGVYVHDPHHFLLAMRRQGLKNWFQELALYHGASLRGLIQILPSTGAGRGISMSDVLSRVVHQESRFAADQLWVRFFSAPHQVLAPHTRDQSGLLTFEGTEFLSLLEMAAVFRTILPPDAQEVLQDLLRLDDPAEEQFYWGRLLGYLTPEARDMLSAWRIRQWPKSRVKLLYELIDYVAFY